VGESGNEVSNIATIANPVKIAKLPLACITKLLLTEWVNIHDEAIHPPNHDGGDVL
jgi:hypothetical protein